jgi:hypothetical protein
LISTIQFKKCVHSWEVDELNSSRIPVYNVLAKNLKIFIERCKRIPVYNVLVNKINWIGLKIQQYGKQRRNIHTSTPLAS